MSTTRRRRPTLDDVAEAVGVSRATVSNAYNRPDQLSAKLREEILRAARGLGYPGPNPTARSLATSRTGAIAFLLDQSLSAAFSDPALSITLDALAKTVDPTGHALLLLPGRETHDGPPAERVLAAQADIAVAYSLADGTAALDAVHARGLALVIIDQPPLPATARVGCDDHGGASLAARHLVELGHRRFGILSAPRVAPLVEPGPSDTATPPGSAPANAVRLSSDDAPSDRSAESIGATRPATVTTASATRRGRATSRQLDTDRLADKRQRPPATASRKPPTDRLAERDTRHIPELTGPRTGLESAQASAFRGTRERLAGYLDVLTAAGITDVTVSEAPWLAASTARASATELLTAEPRPTALLCMSDQLAFAAMTAARRLGLRVPEDVSIVGFDDTPQAAWSDPPLTTVRQDLAGKGRIAGELVLRLLDGDSAPPPIELPVSLIIRESTATI